MKTFSRNESSVAFSSTEVINGSSPYGVGHRWVASNVSVHRSGNWGSLNLNAPIGALAYGIPVKLKNVVFRSPVFSSPCTGPYVVFTTSLGSDGTDGCADDGTDGNGSDGSESKTRGILRETIKISDLLC